MLVLAGLIGFFTALNLGATTVVSREGKAFWLVKALPISYKQQTLAKLLFGISIPVLWAAPLSVACVFLFKMSVFTVLGGFILGMIISIAATAFGMIFDFIKPKLVWTNEAEAIKQNMNGIMGMIVGAVTVGLLALLCYFLIVKSSLEIWTVSVMASGASVILAVLSIILLLKIGQKSLDEHDG